MKFFFFLLYLLPRRFCSRLVGELARLPFPKEILQIFIGLYSRYYSISWEEVEIPPGGFSTFSEFFRRPLKKESRRWQGREREVISPCDGTLKSFGKIQKGRLFQIKGKSYSLAELLASSEKAKHWEEGHYLTLYLSPRNYHRFHVPWKATLKEIRHIPGDAWPVNQPALQRISSLFAKNERLILTFDSPEGEYLFIPVGAFNVSSIRIHGFFPSSTSRICCSKLYQQGEELGWFDMGSTILLIFPPFFQPSSHLKEDLPIQVGETLGFWP